MRAIIPVAGVGSRLRPHTYTIPKVLLNVAGKPILAHILDKLLAEGITAATIVVGHMGEKIREFVAHSYPKFPVEYIDQEEALGLGHAIYLSRRTIGKEPILIILGDTIFDVDLRPVVTGSVSALGVKAVEDPRRFGVAETSDGVILRLVEKPEHPKSNLAVVGLYYITRGDALVECLNDIVARNIRTKGEYQLTDALQLMIQRGERIETFPVEGWYDCGKPETLLATNRTLLEKNPGSRAIEGSVINPPVYVAPTAVLTNCVVGPFTSIGDHAVVEAAIVRNSIVGSNANVSGVLLDNSIIGNDSVVRGSYKRLNMGDSSEIDLY